MAAIVAVVVILAIGGSVLGFLNWKESRRPSGVPDSPRNDSRPEAADPKPSGSAPSSIAARPKSREDLKFGSVTLEKSAGTSLVYAVGTVTNDSTHQRYDVHVEVALTDATGKPAGLAKDYRQVLEPGEAWRFRALVLDSKARAGSVRSITEDE